MSNEQRIRRIANAFNNKPGNFYIIITNNEENLSLALTDELAGQLGIQIDKIKRDFPVIIDEFNSQGVLIGSKKVDSATLSQIIQAIDTSMLKKVYLKDGIEYLVIITNIKTHDEGDNTSTLDQVKALVRAQRTGGNVSWTGDVYSFSDYQNLIALGNPEHGGWDN